MLSQKKIWMKFSLLGAESLSDNDSRTKTIMGVNRLALCVGLINLTIGVAAFIMTRSWRLLIGVLTEVVLASVPLYLNFRRRYVGASLVLYFILCGATLFFCSLLGTLAQVDLMFVVLIASARLLFARRTSRLYSYVIAGCVLVGVKLNYRFNFINPIQVNATIQKILFWTVYLVVFLLVISIFRWYRRFNEDLCNFERRENETKDMFISNAAHEIKVSFQSMFTIINNLHRMLQRMEMREDPGGLKNSIEDLMATCRNTDNIIENIFEYERHMAGKLPQPDNKWVDIRSLLQGIVDVYAAFADEKRVELFLDVSDKLPEEIPCDKRKLRQIIINLLHNAIKFTSHGSSVKVEANLWGHYLTVAVKDHGNGIDETMKKRMFDPFVTKNPEGLGLGLYVVKQMILALNGCIDVGDNEGGGTVITVSLPLAEVAVHQQTALTLQ